MNKIVFWLGIAFAGAAVYVLLADDKDPVSGDYAGEAAAWGTRKRVSGAGNIVGGKLKQGVGRIAGDGDLEAEGALDELAGRAKDAIGNVAQKAGEALSPVSE